LEIYSWDASLPLMPGTAAQFVPPHCTPLCLSTKGIHRKT